MISFNAETTSGKSGYIIMICKRIAGKFWKNNSSIMQWLYAVMISLIVSYEALVIIERTHLNTDQMNLNKIPSYASKYVYLYKPGNEIMSHIIAVLDLSRRE